MRISSFLLSIILHLGALAFILYVPMTPPIDLSKQAYQVSLVMGAPGGEKLPSPVLGARAPVTGKQESAPQAAPKPEKIAAPTPDAAAVPKPELLQKQEPEKLAAPEAKPEPEKLAEPEPKPMPEPEKKPDPIPEKKPDPVEVPKAPEPKEEKKPEPKPEPEKKEPEKKPEPEKKQEPAKKAEPAKKPAPKKPAPKKSSAAADALADMRKQVDSGKGGTSSASRALADLEKQLTKPGVGGGGGDGDGPGGGGIYDVYVAQVILAVQPNWSMPTYSRTNMVVQVLIRLDRSGKVLECKVLNSSGRPEFDASAVNAVLRTGELPPPPTSAQQELIVNFNSQMMMGR